MVVLGCSKEYLIKATKKKYTEKGISQSNVYVDATSLVPIMYLHLLRV